MKEQNPAGVVLILLAYALLVTLVAIPVPNARPASCSASYHSGYYYASGTESGNARYGVGTWTKPATWTFNAQFSQSHQVFWASLDKTGVPGTWSQAGYGWGIGGNGQTSTARVAFVEMSTPVSYFFAWDFGYPTHNGFNMYLQNWNDHKDSNGSYWWNAHVYENEYSKWLAAYMNLGLNFQTGKPGIGAENQYGVNSTCNTFAQYSTSWSAAYTTAIGVQPKLSPTLWSACSFSADSPYSVALTGSCSNTINYSGG